MEVWCIFYTYGTFWFGLATFSGQEPLVASGHGTGTDHVYTPLTSTSKETVPQGPRLTRALHLTAGGMEGRVPGGIMFPSFPGSGASHLKTSLCSDAFPDPKSLSTPPWSPSSTTSSFTFLHGAYH